MCNYSCVAFGQKNILKEDVEGKRVLEIGSYNFNGSLRQHIEQFNPLSYIGLDIQKGPGVDVICKAEDTYNIYGPESFDLIVSTEMLEHVFYWQRVINNIKKMCKYGGKIIITTRSYGFPTHGWPHDHWRFEEYDMRYIFSDFSEHGSVIIENDPDPGVFVAIKKPINPRDLLMIDISNYMCYNVVYQLRIG
jgi:SAM-dependent methyltransferase